MIVRGAVHWVDYRGAVGAEIRKPRPAVVVSRDEHNADMATVTVVPLSSLSNRPVAPYDVAIPAGVVGDGRACRAKPHQIRAVDKSRVGRRVGVLPAAVMNAVERGLLLHVGILDA